MKIRHAVPLLFTSVAGLFFFHSQIATRSTSSPATRVCAAAGPMPGDRSSGLTANQRAFFDQGKDDFEEVEEVADGLGPVMNLDSCGGCHAQPATGGSSPAVNPQVAFATKRGADNKLPSFIRLNGPVREARFVKNPDGTADGGRARALHHPGPRRRARLRARASPTLRPRWPNRNVIFRVPTPVFGAGLIEEITDTTILINRSRDSSTKSALGISGRPEPQRQRRHDHALRLEGAELSLMVFSGEAYNVEMGITNELFQNERDPDAFVQQFATVPNDVQNTDAAVNAATAACGHPGGDQRESRTSRNFQRFLAPPKPDPDTPGGSCLDRPRQEPVLERRCALCHTPSMRTGNATVEALPVPDGEPVLPTCCCMTWASGSPTTSRRERPREGSSAPRRSGASASAFFFLHDGRSDDLKDAIREHRARLEANQVFPDSTASASSRSRTCQLPALTVGVRSARRRSRHSGIRRPGAGARLAAQILNSLSSSRSRCVVRHRQGFNGNLQRRQRVVDRVGGSRRARRGSRASPEPFCPNSGQRRGRAVIDRCHAGDFHGAQGAGSP
jgi:hypothetical protein